MINTEFTPFPVLITERLVLRRIEASDDRDIFDHRSDDAVNTHLDGFRHASLQTTQAFIERMHREVASGQTILWVITLTGSNKFMGTVCLWNISKENERAETGYTLCTEYQNKGYMSEALAKAIDFGFNKMSLRSIEAFTHKDNDRSIRLLLKNGFKRDLSRSAPEGSNRIIFLLTKDGL